MGGLKKRFFGNSRTLGNAPKTVSPLEGAACHLWSSTIADFDRLIVDGDALPLALQPAAKRHPAATAQAATRSSTESAIFALAATPSPSSSSSSSSPPFVFFGFSFFLDLDDDDEEQELETWTWLAKDTRFGGEGLVAMAEVAFVVVVVIVPSIKSPPAPLSPFASRAALRGEHCCCCAGASMS